MNQWFYFSLALLTLISLTNALSDYFEDSDIKILTNLFQHLNIGQAFLIKGVPNYENFLNFKYLMYEFRILTTQVTVNYLKNLLQNVDALHIKTALVLKTDNLSYFKDMFETNPVNVAKFTWIIVTSEPIKYTFRIPYNCEFFMIQNHATSSYDIKEIYYVKHTGPFIINFGHWFSTSNFSLNKKEMYERRNNLRGVTFVRSDHNGVHRCDNFSIEHVNRDIWNYNSRLLNFSLITVNYRSTPDTIVDPTEPDGSTCSIAFHALNYFPSAVGPTSYERAYMIIKYESYLGDGWRSYVKPFEKSLWYAILAWLGISSFSLSILHVYSDDDTDAGIFTSIYTLCEQDGITSQYGKVISPGIKLAYLMSLIVSRIIVPAYAAAILAILTVQKPKVPFHDLEGFVQEGNYKIGTLNNTFLIKYFEISTNALESSIYRKMFISKKEYPNYREEAVKMTCSDKKIVYMGFTYEMSELNQYARAYLCKLHRIAQPFASGYSAFRLRPNSPFLEVFKKILFKYYTAGIIDRDGISNNMPKESISDDSKPLTMPQLSPILSLVLIGIFASFNFLALEIIIYKRRSMKSILHVSDKAENLQKN